MAASQGPPELTAENLMTTPVIACRIETFFEELVELLFDHDVSGLPVVDERGRLVGVVSERDLAHTLGNALVRTAIRRPLHSGNFARPLEDFDRSDRTVGSIMSTPAIAVHPDTPLHAIAEIMFREEINRVPVVLDERLVGIVTRGDVLRGLAGLTRRRARVLRSPLIPNHVYHDPWGNESPDADGNPP